MTRVMSSAAVAIALALVLSFPAPSSRAAGTTSEAPALATRQIIERVERLRGLEALAEVPLRSVSAEVAIAEQIADLTAEDVAELEADEELLKRLGMLPPDIDLVDTLVSLVGTDVAGYYRPDQCDIALVEVEDRLGVLAEWILAHEYVHALQDQHYDIEATQDAHPEGDAQAAILALVEGDATFLMTAMAVGDAMTGAMVPSTIEQAGLGLDESQLLSLPKILARELLFSYIDGMYFVQRMWGRGGWSNVDGVWLDPPVSTEQVMHPERYPAERPVHVELRDLAALLGPGWSTSHATTMGELRLSVLVAGTDDYEIPFVSLVGIELPRAEAADGWAGDTIVSLDGPDGAWALVWQTTWDTAEDAAEFAPAASGALPGFAEVHSVVAGRDISDSAPDDHGVLLLVADEPSTLAAVRTVLAPEAPGIG